MKNPKWKIKKGRREYIVVINKDVRVTSDKGQIVVSHDKENRGQRVKIATKHGGSFLSWTLNFELLLPLWFFLQISYLFLCYIHWSFLICILFLINALKYS